MGPIGFPETSARITTICCVITPKRAVLVYFAVEASNHECFQFTSKRYKQNQNTRRPNKNQSYKDLFPKIFNNNHCLTKQYDMTPFKKPVDSVQSRNKLRGAEFYLQGTTVTLHINNMLQFTPITYIPNGLFPTSKWICWR